MVSDLTAADQRDRKAMQMARDELSRLNASGFKEWVRDHDLNDPFIHELYLQYRADDDRARFQISGMVTRTILRCARRYRVRFLSLCQHHLICFEGVQWLKAGCLGYYPIAWRVADVLKIGENLGRNNAQAQIDLRDILEPLHFATYDLRDKHSPLKVGHCITLTGDMFTGNSIDSKVQMKTPLSLLDLMNTERLYSEVDSLASYLRTCGVEPHKPPLLAPDLATVADDPAKLPFQQVFVNQTVSTSVGTYTY
ncbi:unnamed protein product [Sphagnum tenellum]